MMFIRKSLPLVSTAFLLAPFWAQAQTPAFPGALGFGANAYGGRYGSVYHVTTLADSGTGSFRDAVSSGNRIIVFDVGGYISLNSAVSVSGNNITIAGQTAPGGGIGIKGGKISFNNRSNIVCRHIRIRPGSETASNGDVALNILDARNVICDHLSVEFAPWNNFGGVSDDWQNKPVTDITVMNSIIANPTYQRFGAHTECIDGKWSWIYNLWSDSHGRQPLAKINTVYVNNVVYDYQAAYDCGDTSGEFSHDVVNNYFITGPITTSAGNNWYQMNANQTFYVTGNLRDSNNNGVLDGSGTAPGGVVITNVPWSSITTNIPTFSTQSAYRYNLSAAGAWPRDQVDQQVVNTVKSLGSAGQLWNSQTATGLGNNGYGVINGGVPPIDTDGDGMPDYWEKAIAGLNYLVNDSMNIAPDGYANIEHYINWLGDPHVLTVTNTAVDVDLWQYTSGFTNASPVYSITNLSNGVVTLNSGHIAHFAPTMDFSGMGAFQFSVAGSDGTTYTNVVSILMSPITPPANLIWLGDGTLNSWDVGISTNWDNGLSLVVFNSGDDVTFDDTGSNTPAITMASPITAGTVSVLAAQDYTFTGSGFAGGTKLNKIGTGKLTLNNANSLGGGMLITEGIVQLGDEFSVNGSIAGNVTNNDTLILANPTSTTSSANISGSGELIKRGTGNHTVSGTQSYTNLTTIEAGTLTFSGTPPSGSVTNNGTLSLSLSSSLTYSGSISGPGSLNISASGQTVTLGTPNSHAGGTTNSSGTLRILNNAAAGSGPVVYFSGSVLVGNGIVITNPFKFDSTTDYMMDTYGGGTCTWAGDVIPLSGGASFRPGGNDGRLVLTGTGALGSRNFIIPKGSVDLGGNADFSASGSANAFGRNDTANSAFVTIKDNATALLSPLNLGGGRDTGGRITVTIRDNGHLSTGTQNFDLHNSTRTTTWTSVFLNGGMLTVGGFVKTRTGASQLTTNYFNGGTLAASKDNTGFLPALSGLTAYVQTGGAVVDDKGYAITIAAPLQHDPTLGSALDGGLNKLGAGTLTLSGANTYNGGTIVSNGTLLISASGSIANTTNIYVAAGALFDASATGLTLGSGKQVSGDGSVSGNFTLSNGAILSPGSSPGTLTFNNNLTLDAGSVLNFELGSTSDQVVVGGALSPGGTLNVTNVAGFGAATYTLFSAGSVGAGSFALGSMPAGYNYTVTNTPTEVKLIVASTAPLVFGSVQLLGGSLVVTGCCGTPGELYSIYGSTNVALPASNWSLVLTNVFSASGGFSFTNVVSTGPAQQFYRLQVP